MVLAFRQALQEVVQRGLAHGVEWERRYVQGKNFPNATGREADEYEQYEQGSLLTGASIYTQVRFLVERGGGSDFLSSKGAMHDKLP